jgi:ATP-dependent Clp endopeptidase proteolytic subunit ClpP
VKRKPWYAFKAQADPSVADVDVMGIIGDWIDEYYGFGDVVTAKQFAQDLAALPDTVKSIRVHINSPGGDVFAGVTIANALRSQSVEKGRSVQTIAEGLAASAASIILMAGDVVTIADNALVMIHNPWTMAVGGAADMRKAADSLDAIRDALVSTYQWHSPLSTEEIVALMDAETWMDAEEALAKGFATEISEGMRAAACVDQRALGKLRVPDRFADRISALTQAQEEPPSPEPVGDPEPALPPAAARASFEQVYRACRQANVTDFVDALVARAPAEEDLETLVRAEADRRAAEASRAENIRGLSKVMKGRAEGRAQALELMVASGMTEERARALVQTVNALLDNVEIDSSLKPDAMGGGKPKAGTINHRAIYDRMNNPAGNVRLFPTRKE